MQRILLCTDGSIFAQSSYRYAAWIAPLLEAHIDVLYVTDIRSQRVASTGNLSGSIGIDASKELLKKLVDLEHEKAKLNHQRAKLILEDAKQFFQSVNFQNVSILHETGFLVDIFQKFEDTTDLIMLGKRGEAAEFASGHLGANTDRIVRTSRKPCFITSRQFQPVERLLLAYDGSQSSQKALKFLVQSPALKGLELHILTVTKKLDDAAAIAHLNDAEQQAKAAGFLPISQLVQGNPETAIASYIPQHNISLLLMGVYGHRRIRHLVIGTTTAQTLRSSNIPVLLFR
ncbi:MAG: universal stress protein [Cyanobacteria bacterium J069]|nr:MAG: universal stress protein [Cyanobacteria bacterium J069]